VGVGARLILPIGARAAGAAIVLEASGAAIVLVASGFSRKIFRLKASHVQTAFDMR
jgi:hypothetical protein